ncbi:hypothetical protein HGRIS_002674 [Hohenbuehelia grisea]|uniref:Uncharacterized protein n=1 Tax=Hohenbuehelia grisea TaxID=104357 RepID=A0ABR3JMD0_9AGAR
MAVLYDYPLPRRSMLIWYLCEVVIAQLAMTGVEIVMMARVYALYRRHPAIKICFTCLLAAEMITVIVGIVVNIPGSDFEVDHILSSTPGSFAYFGIAAMVSQLAIMTLLIVRYKRRLDSEGPFLKMMLFDGTTASIGLLIVSFVLMLYTLLHFEFATTSYAWLLVFVSCAGCRLILNLQTLPRNNHLSATASLQLTTIYMEKSISISESTV